MYLQPRQRHKTIFVIIVQIRQNYRSARGHPYAVHFVLDVGAYIFLLLWLFCLYLFFGYVLFYFLRMAFFRSRLAYSYFSADLKMK